MPNIQELKTRIDQLERVIKESQRIDGWTNMLVGLGQAQDKQRATHYSERPILLKHELSMMYLGDGLGRRIVDCVADDMTREWFKVTVKDDEKDKVIKDVLDALPTRGKFNACLKWQRLFGGALLMIGFLDGNDLQEPLDIPACKGIGWLYDVDMWDIDLVASTWDRDPTSPMFGSIIQYLVQFRMSGTGVITRKLVHASRCLEFHGDIVPKSILLTDQRTRFWGASSIQTIWDQLRNMGGVSTSVMNLLYEFVISVYKFDDLANLVSTPDGTKTAINRMEIINMSKSIINGVLLDKDEDFQRVTATVSGLAELIDRFMMFLSAVSEIPVTRLFGRSPSGLDATGDSDLTNYYDMIGSRQTVILHPQLVKFITLIITVYKLGDPNQLRPNITFNSLRKLTDKESADLEQTKATTYKTNVDADVAYINAGVLTAEDVIKARNLDVNYSPTETTLPGGEADKLDDWTTGIDTRNTHIHEDKPKDNFLWAGVRKIFGR
jgi:phage-related protein (TIGR01555 family)